MGQERSTDGGSARDLSHVLDRLRCGASLPNPELSARDLFERGKLAPPELLRRFGVLAHYTTREAWNLIREAGSVGLPGRGVHLSPTGQPAWLAAAELGLPRPIEVCLIVETSGLQQVYGPGVAIPSSRFPGQWPGGGIEFFVSQPIPRRSIVQLLECGSGRSHRLV